MSSLWCYSQKMGLIGIYGLVNGTRLLCANAIRSPKPRSSFCHPACFWL